MQRDDCNSLEERLRLLEVWAAEHDGKINSYWESQRSWNNRVDEKLTCDLGRIIALEKRLVWLSGVAAGLGGTLGGVVSRFLA